MKMENETMTKLSFLAIGLGLALQGCGDVNNGANPDRPFGETTIVVVVNPVINDGNTTTVPAVYDETRVSGIGVDAHPGDSDTTDENGFAVLDELDPGVIGLVFDGGPELPVTVMAEGDVLDLAVAYDGESVEAFPNFPIRYEVGGEILEFDSEADPTDVAEALSTDGNIVFFKNGVYSGDLLVTGDDVIFFGEGFTEHEVVIDGSVEVRGTNVRIRGFTITGDIEVWGNSFGMAFSAVKGATAINGNAVSFLANEFCGGVTVPSSNATLLHNAGMAPMDAPPPDACE
jgi:hypothetical protein